MACAHVQMRTGEGGGTASSVIFGSIAKSFGLTVRESQPGRKDTRGLDIDHGFAERTTFIVTPDGRIAATIGGLAPADNVQKALDAVEALAAKKQVRGYIG